ncbi:helix-turn-helix domain-containing protein [Burkholderia sp. A1]|uniref:helix-turn-helix domain-containing protein n=1 Tax=Burkholderia sp. A1 TaxID=148446 RepID=UPI00046B019A|nr:helix-turn-helix domain-containing protein [Burkholderia sp. A1]
MLAFHLTAARRARNSSPGRKPALDSAQRRLALELLQEKSVAEVASLFDVHPRTVKRIMKA